MPVVPFSGPATAPGVRVPSRPPADEPFNLMAVAMMAEDHPRGQNEKGNIDLNNRPMVKNSDGSTSTVRSITVTNDDGSAILLPTVVGGKVVSNKDAIDNYRKTGEHLGKFDSEDSANAYAESLHKSQAKQYGLE